MPRRRQTYLDLLDIILLEMAANHPSLPADQEVELKDVLMEIMADEQGWQERPDEMVARFDSAMQVLRSLRRVKGSWLD